MTTRTLYFIALALLAISLIINVINGFAIFSTILTGVAGLHLAVPPTRKCGKNKPANHGRKSRAKIVRRG